MSIIKAPLSHERRETTGVLYPNSAFVRVFVVDPGIPADSGSEFGGIHMLPYGTSLVTAFGQVWFLKMGAVARTKHLLAKRFQ